VSSVAVVDPTLGGSLFRLCVVRHARHCSRSHGL
jgi:hypothetical protein